MRVYEFNPELSLCMKLIRRHNFLDYLRQTEPPEELLHAPESGDVAAVAEGHSTSSFFSSLRQDVLPIRGQSVHKAESREKTIARCVLFAFFFPPSSPLPPSRKQEQKNSVL